MQNLPGSKATSRITVSKNRFSELNSGKDGHEDNRSEESILPLQSNAITKTTVVTVDREIGDANAATDLEAGDRRMQWGNAPEREIEDRI